MVNCLVPALNGGEFFKDCIFPKLLYEVDGKPMIEVVLNNLNDIEDVNFIFVLSEEECNRFHLDSSIRVLTSGKCEIIKLSSVTQGALCSCLMAIEFINNADPLIIANCDQVIDVNYNDVLNSFHKQNADAGVISFESVHPRWSYIHVGSNGDVDEFAEKHPLTREAVAGFYWFRSGADFVSAAEQSILKESSLGGKYYISSALNELILQGKRIRSYAVPSFAYHSFYSPERAKLK